MNRTWRDPLKFSVAVECREHPGGIAGWHDSSRMVRLSDPVALILINEDNEGYWINEADNAEAFRRIIGPSNGAAVTADISGMDLALKRDGKLVLQLTNFYLCPTVIGVAPGGKDGGWGVRVIDRRRRIFGTANWKLSPNGGQWNAWTWYRRIIYPADMNPDERTYEMLNMVSDGLFYDELGAQARGLVEPQSLAMMAAVMALCAAAGCTIAVVGAALGYLLGALGVATDWVRLEPLWQEFLRCRLQARTEAELRGGAQALAQVMAGIVMNFVTFAVCDAAGRRIKVEDIKEALTGKSRAEWEQAIAKGKSKPYSGNATGDAPVTRWEPPPNQSLRAAIRENIATAKRLTELAERAARSGDKVAESQLRLQALENWIEAEWGFQFDRSMYGHSHVVQEIARWTDTSVLPKIKSLSPQKVVEHFQSVQIDNLSLDEAAVLVGDARGIQPGEITTAAKAHDFRPNSSQSKARNGVGGGMKYPSRVLRADRLAALRQAELEPDPDVRAAKIIEFINTEPDPALKEQYINWWRLNIFGEMVERSARSSEGVARHNQGEPHHDVTNPDTPASQSGAEWWHHGDDAYHSKIMNRPYQGAALNIDAPVNPYGSLHDKAVIKLGQYAVKTYVYSEGRFSRYQIVNCEQISPLKRKSLGF